MPLASVQFSCSKLCRLAYAKLALDKIMALVMNDGGPRKRTINDNHLSLFIIIEKTGLKII